LTATAANGTSIQLQWTDNDSSATGYNVLRSTDNVHFSQIGTISSPDATSFTDSTVTSGHAYSYEVNAFSGTNVSADSLVATVTTPLAGVSSLTATAQTATSVQLKWTDNDASATGYNVLRSTDGSTFTMLIKIASATAVSYTDTTTTSAKEYYYRVQAYDTATTSAVSNTASATTPMFFPSALQATQVGSYVNLTWINQDPTTTSYILSRSTDGTNFTQLTVLSSAGSTTYADTTATVGQKYYYEVQATNGTLVSFASNIANITPIDTGGGSVAITTRYGNELVITATGVDDTVSLSQSGSLLTVNADGQTYTDPVPTAGLFVYTRGGSDGINVASSVTVRTTLETIDGALTDITSAGTNVDAWIDSTDLYSGTGAVNRIASFAGGVSKATGVSLKDPTDSGAVTHFNGSLWGTGPVAGDVNQGSVGDCYFLSSLAAFAGEKPSVLMQSAVDMGDGTYTVQFYSGTTPVDVRVSNDMPQGGFNGYAFAHPGADGTGWAMVMEKAFAYFRTGANTYASISSGWMGTVYANLGVASTDFFPTNYTESEFYTMVSNDLATGNAVTLGTVNAPNLVSDHAYTLISCSIDSSGVTHYVVRNPWGVSGDSLENSNGYATLTFAQLKANFYDGCQAA
jgi:fibronectin type 3 domain-containing protein